VPDSPDVRPKYDPDPFLLEGRLEHRSRLRVDTRHQAVAALDDGHVRSEAPVELGELAAGDASAQHDQASRYVVC
jgi:hypothetical protein